MSKTPKAFVLYPNQWSALKELSFNDLGMLFTGLYRAMNGEEIETLERGMSKDTLLAFRFLMIQINIDIEKYLDKLEKNRERQERYRQEATLKKNNAYKKENKNENENENEKENENENEKENEKEDVVDTASAVASASQQQIFLRFKEEAPITILPWINQILDDAGSSIPKLRRMTDERMKRLFALMQQYGNADIGEALRKAARSPFLNGRGKRNKFVANIDWILDEEHFLDVLEGKFNAEV